MSQPTVAGIVNRLTQKGMIELIGDSEDKRIKYVALTEAGHSSCQATCVQKDIMEHRMMDALSESEQAEFKAMLFKIWSHLVD